MRPSARQIVHSRIGQPGCDKLRSKIFPSPDCAMRQATPAIRTVQKDERREIARFYETHGKA